MFFDRRGRWKDHQQTPSSTAMPREPYAYIAIIEIILEKINIIFFLSLCFLRIFLIFQKIFGNNSNWFSYSSIIFQFILFVYLGHDLNTIFEFINKRS